MISSFRTVLICALAIATVTAPMSGVAAEGSEAGQQVQVQKVEVLMSPIGPVVLLQVRNKAVPIFVDLVVAESIQGALSGQKPARPLTHDLMHDVIDGFNGKVTRVVITLKDKVFHAALTVAMREGTKVFDSRSSDAIALAIHFKAPILINEETVDAVGIEVGKPGEVRSRLDAGDRRLATLD
jgi:uncharacterized protein